MRHFTYFLKINIAQNALVYAAVKRLISPNKELEEHNSESSDQLPPLRINPRLMREGGRGEKKVYLIFFCEIGAGFQQHTGRESGFIS